MTLSGVVSVVGVQRVSLFAAVWSLACVSGHDEEKSVLAFRDGFYRGIDCIGLVVARPFTAAVFKIILHDNLFFIRSESFPSAVLGPKVFG
jgi:hypothetical protein